MNTLFVISTKNPTQLLIDNVSNIYNIQQPLHSFKICVVDSDSTNLTFFSKLQDQFPLVDIHFVKNKHYEFGAWKFAYHFYPNYDIYVCLQDSLLIRKPLPLHLVNDSTVLTFHHPSGFSWHPSIKPRAIQILKDSHFTHFSHLIDTNFTLATHSSFVLTNFVLHSLFSHLPILPSNKDESCCYERIFGLFFILHHFTTINIAPSLTKFHGNRL